ncbi:hypothetical protein BX616_009175 [Lobosporangium transversale]|uniref:Uncharacterized protein n=1 Tax=Lobosporangium transversale TaxID=64571 RepID=A0A1Y2GZS8_9FUNG|nr:hypothetical protein BCR41DRAFT_345935 [Lobosporangium transversale]KAF9913995.1 hypothetical protein BX616_009175 [Lobosporangium transversale]ORZ27807.1 hypothetical protein BCR41DRAFT_345935 [Lobosporangium transversale]|eukprot:XP_021885510.1 hypothetical protein BCR41DRAFT_345935 [Lobosporangium transversale]
MLLIAHASWPTRLHKYISYPLTGIGACTQRAFSQQIFCLQQDKQHHHLSLEESPRSMYDRGHQPDPDELRRLLTKGIRAYFYFIDVHGQVFLQDTNPKNFTSCYKDPKFLDFFLRRIKPNSSPFFSEYAWQSPCGKEINFVESADTPLVFHGFQDGNLLWAGTQRTPFLPEKLCVSASTGRIYHPLPPSLQIAIPSSSTDMNANKRSEWHRGCTLGLIKSSLVLSEFAADLDEDSVVWQGTRHLLKKV